MGPYARAVLSVIRLAAGGFIVVGLIMVGSLLFEKGNRGMGIYLLKGWAVFVGIILLAFGGKIARAVTRDIED